MVRYLSVHDNDTDGTETPSTDERDVTGVVPAAVAEILDIAETWLGWDGRPIYADGNAWTPHKALRRVGDHLLDHLAEIEVRLAGQPTFPDQWHGRLVTLDADFARITEVDLDECTSRLTRLAACYQARLSGLDRQLLDTRPATDTWTIRGGCPPRRPRDGVCRHGRAPVRFDEVDRGVSAVLKCGSHESVVGDSRHRYLTVRPEPASLVEEEAAVSLRGSRRIRYAETTCAYGRSGRAHSRRPTG